MAVASKSAAARVLCGIITFRSQTRSGFSRPRVLEHGLLVCQQFSRPLTSQCAFKRILKRNSHNVVAGSIVTDFARCRRPFCSSSLKQQGERQRTSSEPSPARANERRETCGQRSSPGSKSRVRPGAAEEKPDDLSEKWSIRRGYKSLRINGHLKYYRNVAIFSVTFLITAIIIWNEVAASRALSIDHFSHFNVVSREDVSPTAFILALRLAPPQTLVQRMAQWQDRMVSALLGGPHDRAVGMTKAEIYAAWRNGGTWSVEVKQPELQITREYTPLPPLLGDEAKEPGLIRILVRRISDGAVSSYLNRLMVGDPVELRGPHLGLNVTERLGVAGEELVAVVGGTGIAPALQAARALLEPIKPEQRADESVASLKSRRPSPKSHAHPMQSAREGRPLPRVTILWANRKRADCLGCSDMSAVVQSSELRTDHGEADSPIVRQLKQWQSRYPNQLRVHCAVDEESTFISAKTISNAIETASSMKRRKKDNTDAEVYGEAQDPLSVKETSRRAEACFYHSSKLLRRETERDPVDAKCECFSSRGGKNLLLVSGPEGFVETYAGPKEWSAGKQRQGLVRGLIGQLMAANASAWDDWLVLKL